MISCIILSAGLSSRFGSPKATASLGHQTVIEHIQKLVLSTDISEIIIVLGAYADAIKPHLLNHKNVKVVYNKDYIFGQTSSFKVGLENLSLPAKGVMLWPVDYPLIKAETVNHLIKIFKEEMPAILIPTFENKKGHPPIFNASLRNEFLGLDHSVGINTVAMKHQQDVLLCPINDSGVLKSFNTPEEFFAIQKSV